MHLWLTQALSLAAPTCRSQCDAFGSTYVSQTWTLRVSLAVYVMALQSVAGG